ncbi:MAG: cache domain-containing protein [Anaerolineae bacterium]|nr:cache domain-containing protein [Anaerolineae bacterium]
MADISRGTLRGQRLGLFSKSSYTIPIATKLIASFLAIIVTGNAVFTVVGISVIGDRVVTEAQERVRTDLNAAREIYHGELRHIYDVVRLTARRPPLLDVLQQGETEQVYSDLTNLQRNEGLDVLTLTDASGKVVLRISNPDNVGDDQSQDEVVSAVLRTKEPVAATEIVSAENLQRESALLADRAYLIFIDTPKARARPETEETAGMMLKVAAPVFDSKQNLVGVLYGGVLLNRNYDIVDTIKQTVFQGAVYEGKDIGTATIFQDDVRISTNVLNENGTRAIATRVAADVYDQVIVKGEPWIGQAYVVNDWYITAYEPIRNIDGNVIGIIYVGILEQKYVDIRNRTTLTYLAISLIGVLVSVILSYFIARGISVPVRKLVSASKELANGNLEVKVERTSNDEIGELAEAYNAMAAALRERDEKLKDFTRKKFMESEKLALIGQLAANVAHELNNPLQGIVTYSHLLLEKNTCSDTSSRSNLQKITVQADRCRDIIRGLLDFSRQRKPDKTLCNINTLLQDCLSLIQQQALFHNVHIELKLDTELPSVVIDPSQIERVFINLIVNAAEAMDGLGRLTISTRRVSINGDIEIEVTDTGHGISEENLERIFDPFFTTKETGHGVGLGLAISYGIVKEHKGALLVESEVEKGTTFVVRLPITATEAGVENGQQA